MCTALMGTHMGIKKRMLCNSQVIRSCLSNNNPKPKSIFKHYQRNSLLDARSPANKNLLPQRWDNIEPVQKPSSASPPAQQHSSLAKKR